MTHERRSPSPPLEPADETTVASPQPVPETPPPPASEPSADDWATRFKYLLADFENFRKRAERDSEGIRQRARAQLLRDLLPVYEAFQRARLSTEGLSPSDPIRRGLDLIGHEFDRFFQREELEPVARVGAKFDPTTQEAVAETPATSNHPEETIVEVVQQGYHTRMGLLRPAKVVVARPVLPDTSPRKEPAYEEDDRVAASDDE